jgi:uncharacterized membrane protein
MTTLATHRFDPIDYARQLRSVGVTQEQADIQAQTIERVIADVTSNQDLSSKQDIKNLTIEINNNLATMELRLVKWIIGVGAASVLALIGILKFIH